MASCLSGGRNRFRGGGAQHTLEVVRSVVKDKEIRKIAFWYVSSGAANAFRYHARFGQLAELISEKAIVTFERGDDRNSEIDIETQIHQIHQKSRPRDKIILLVGHSQREDPIYFEPLLKYFGEVVKIGAFSPSSVNGEESLGGEQAFFVIRH